MNGKHSLFVYPPLLRRAPAKRNGWLKAGTALLSLLLHGPGGARAGEPGVTHYPDLQPYPPYDLRVEFDDSGHKLLKFSVANANFGQHLPGQSLDIAGLPNGTYWLLVTADPGNVLAEGGMGKSNNVSGTKFQLYKQRRIRILQSGQ